MSPPPRSYPGGDATSGEELESDATNNERITPRQKWNDTSQARHWCLTFNNYTSEDVVNFEQGFEKGRAEVVTAIIGKEVGENGTRHLQGYIHFMKVKRQSAVHKFFGYDSPCMHLSVQGKEGQCKGKGGKPPLAAFRYCMKENDYYVVGKNLDEEDRLKVKTKVGTGRCSDSYTRITGAIEKGEVTIKPFIS